MKNVNYQSLNHEKKRKGFLRVPHALPDNFLRHPMSIPSEILVTLRIIL